VISRKNKGFSLIELLIVMVIMGMLASLVAPKLFGNVDKSKVKTAQAQMQNLSTALDTYRLDVGVYPNSLAELISSDKQGWSGPYLKKAVPQDPWKFDYQYELLSNGDFKLMSFGQGGKEGGKDLAQDLIL
jgi:general secretion pathway protein G